MLDLFGHEATNCRGHPIDDAFLSESEVEELAEILLAEGCLITSMAESLQRLKRAVQSGTHEITSTRREGWENLMWCFDLWESAIPFETACEIASADPEVIRNRVAMEFKDEIKLMIASVGSMCPQTLASLKRKMRRYIEV